MTHFTGRCQEKSINSQLMDPMWSRSFCPCDLDDFHLFRSDGLLHPQIVVLDMIQTSRAATHMRTRRLDIGDLHVRTFFVMPQVAKNASRATFYTSEQAIQPVPIEVGRFVHPRGELTSRRTEVWTSSDMQTASAVPRQLSCGSFWQNPSLSLRLLPVAVLEILRCCG